MKTSLTKKGRKLLSACLALAMALSLLPTQAVALSLSDRERPAQTLTLPVISEDEVAPAPQGMVDGGAVSTLALTENEEKCSYAYVGMESHYTIENFTILDPETREPVTVQPETGGLMQVVGEDGTVLAASDAISYYGSHWDSDAHAYTYYYVYSEEINEMQNVPAGRYALQLFAGNTTYPLDGTLVVVSQDKLLLKNAYCSLYIGKSTADVRLTIYGLETEDELKALSFTMTNRADEVVARSTGGYKDYEFYTSGNARYCYFYAELKTEEGAVFEAETTYSFTLSYTGDKTLVDGVGAMTRNASKPTISCTGFDVLDAQTGLIAVNFENWDAEATYDVVVRNGSNSTDAVIGEYHGKITDGAVEIQLSLNGVTMPMTSYGQWLYVKYGEAGQSSYKSDSYENPYYNLSDGRVSFSPYYISTSATSVRFTMDYYNGKPSAWKGSGDVLELRYRNGTVAGRCDSITLNAESANYGSMTGVMTLSSLEDGIVYVYLNGVDLEDGTWVTDELELSWSLYTSEYSAGQFWTDLGELRMTIDAVNSTETGWLTIEDADSEEVMLTSETVTGTDEDEDGMISYVFSIPADDVKKALTDGNRYSFVFHSGEQTYTVYTYAFDATVTELDFTNGDHFYASWYGCEVGEAAVSAWVYVSRGPRNIGLDALDGVTGFTLTNGTDGTTYAVTGWGNGYWDGDYHFDLELDQPLTAGEYTVFFEGTQYKTFTIYAPTAEDTVPRLYKMEYSAADGYVEGENLPEGSTYTARLYSGYTCLTTGNPIPLTLQNGTYQQSLLFPSEAVSGLKVGLYELRVYMDGKLLGSCSLRVSDTSQPVVKLDGSTRDGRIFYGAYYEFDVANAGTWTHIRTAESLEALEAADYDKISSHYGYDFSEGMGEKTVYAQLRDADGVTEGEVLTFKCWLMDSSGTLNLTLPDDLQGIYSGENITLSIGAECQYADAYVTLTDSDGSETELMMSYQGYGKAPKLYPDAVYGLESAHPYAYGDEKTSWSYTIEGAEKLEVTFSPVTYTRERYDYIYIYSGTGDSLTQVGSYCGTKLAGQTVTVPGDTVTIKLSCSYSSSKGYYGFAVTSVVDPDAQVEEEEDTTNYKHIYSITLANVQSTYGNYKDTEFVSFSLKDGNNNIVGESEQRLLIFGNPSAVLLPKFQNTNSAVYFNASPVALYGYATPGSTVTFTEGDETLATAKADAYGRFDVMLTLEDGYHYVTVTDENTSVNATKVSFTVDTVAPVIESINFTFAEDNSGNATIRWECNDSDIDYYEIYKNNVKVGTVSGSADKVLSVTAKMDDGNWFTVKAYDKAGNMGEKTVSTADQEPPTAPETLEVTAVTATTVTLSWSAGTDNIGVLGYDIYINGREHERLTGTDTTYTVTGLTQGTEYSFTVLTRDKAGNTSESSPAATAKTVTLTLNDGLAESYIVDVYRDKHIPVSVTLASDSESYAPGIRDASMQYRRKGTENWTDVSLRVSGSTASGSWDISGSEDGYLAMGEYEIKFEAADSYGAVVTGEAKVTLLKRDDVPPTQPGKAVATCHSTTTITFGWEASTDNVGVDHYVIYRDGVQVGVTEDSGAHYRDSGLTQGTSYSYTVAAVDARGNTSVPSEATTLSTMVLEFADVIELEDSYTLEDQVNKLIAVWARFKPEEGYAPQVSIAMEYRAADAGDWMSVAMTNPAEADDANYFTGSWSVAGDELGYLPAGTYKVRFSARDEASVAYSETQTVMLAGETEKPEITMFRVNGKAEPGTVGGRSINLSARATDNVGVMKIVFSYAAAGSGSFTRLTEVEIADRAQYTASYDNWDASALPSGSYQIKAEAYDARGNVGEKIMTVTIDNTPPATPGSFEVTATSRYIRVMWSAEREPDFYRFNVYRATAGGAFECVSSTNAIGYYDDGKTAEAGKAYSYYVTAVDVYGNESAPTQTLSATFVNDTESPKIGDMLPRDEAGLRKEVTLKVTAADNYRLSTAIFYYRAQGASEWTKIGETSVKEITNNTVFAYNWTIPAAITEKGSYQLRAEVYDASYTDLEAASGYTANAPAVMERTVTIYPYHAPVAPEATAEAGYKRAELSWTYSGDTDTLRWFGVYATDAKGGNKELISTVKAGKSGTYTAAIPASGEQYFVVKAVDTYGAAAASRVLSVTSLPKETEPPVAVILPETLTAAANVPFTFSGVNSTDNDEIASYSWSFGDGATGSGAVCLHTYTAEGDYTVQLTVTDACGNSNTATARMTVYSVEGADATHALMTVKLVNAYVEGTPAVAGADVKLYTADGAFESAGVSDENGQLTVVVPRGELTISATAEGFVATSRTVEVTPDTTGCFTYTVGLTPMNVSLVDGSLSVTEMTYDEIVAAGIDVNAPDNNHVWKFAATLEFTAGPAFPYELPSIPVTGYFNNSGTFLGGTGWGWSFFGFGGSGGGGGWGGMNIGIFPISENFVLVIYGEAHWLKEMYNVELLVINNSYVDDITDCFATLTLPEGLSLATMVGEQQKETVEIGTIAHKTAEKDNANTEKVNWYVRGDAEGEYNLTATVTGRNPEPFVKEFTTDKPVKVYAGSALKLTITAQDIAYRGEEYHVQFKLENVSHKSLYNLSFGITGAEQFRIRQWADGLQEKTELSHEDFGKGMTRSIKELKPGGSITIDFYTTVWFNSLLELADMGPFDVGYYLTNVFVTTLEGSTTTVPYEVNIQHTPHGSFYEFLWDQLKDGLDGKVTDLIDDYFFAGIPLTGTMSKIYSLDLDEQGNAASHATITIENGRFIESHNVLATSAGVSALSADNSAIVVYTDAPKDKYTISDDGKTMTLDTSARIYVEGAADGTGKMNVTTYTYHSDTDEYKPNLYKLEYQVDMDGTGGSGADVILQAPTESTVAVPYAGKAASVSFPYRVLDENGRFLLEAENAQWTVTGADTTGLHIEKGVLTIEPTAKAGVYTVTLTVGDKSASQSITLTREDSVAKEIRICRGGVELTKDVLRAPETGSLCYAYTATVLDQYGVAFETAVTWQFSGSASGVTNNSGSVAIAVNAKGSFALTASADSVTQRVEVSILENGSIQVDESRIEDTAATAKLTNTGSTAVTVQGMIVAYDKDGRMIAMDMAELTLEAGKADILKLTYAASAEVATVKVFVLNGQTYEPLTVSWKSGQ